MYVLIGGAGMMGLGLAQRLLELGHMVAIIDTDPLSCRFAREKIGVMAFEGSAVSTTVLIEAGIKQANAVVATLRDDALNLALMSFLCKLSDSKRQDCSRSGFNHLGCHPA